MVGAALRSPAPEDAIAQLATALGRQVPSELSVLLRWHDGQRGDSSIILCEGAGLRLLSIAEIRSKLARLRDGSSSGNTIIPFLGDSTGSIMLAIDTSKPHSHCRLLVKDSPSSISTLRCAESLRDFFSLRATPRMRCLRRRRLFRRLMCSEHVENHATRLHAKVEVHLHGEKRVRTKGAAQTRAV